MLRIFVDEGRRKLARAGGIAKQRLFPGYPDFVLNTIACVGAADGPNGVRLYTDPQSIWFNVFIGIYQVDAPKPAWKRPFAYGSADGVSSQIEFEDLARIGKADWNWFSNWMYGTPTSHVEQYDTFDSPLETSQLNTVRIGTTNWHHVRMSDVAVVSAYESSTPGAPRLVRNTSLAWLWRSSFGPPRARPDWPESFIGTRLQSEAYVAYWEDESAYHTVAFGASGAMGADPEFLNVQCAALRSVIEQSYPTLGF